MSLAVPTIHSNGTSEESLLEQFGDARVAILKAQEALAKAAPNGRDYYPQGDAALRKAQDEHRARVDALTRVEQELYEIMEAILG